MKSHWPKSHLGPWQYFPSRFQAKLPSLISPRSLMWRSPPRYINHGSADTCEPMRVCRKDLSRFAWGKICDQLWNCIRCFFVDWFRIGANALEIHSTRAQQNLNQSEKCQTNTKRQLIWTTTKVEGGLLPPSHPETWRSSHWLKASPPPALLNILTGLCPSRQLPLAYSNYAQLGMDTHKYAESL